MDTKLCLWNIHDWLNERGVDHFFSQDDASNLFKGIRLLAPGIDRAAYAVVYDAADSDQYQSVLSFMRGKICFRSLSSADVMTLLSEILFSFTSWDKELTRAIISKDSTNRLLSIAASMFHMPLLILSNTNVEACTDDAASSIFNALDNKLSDPGFISACYEALNKSDRSDDIFTLYMESSGWLIISYIPVMDHFVLLIAIAGHQKPTPANLVLFNQISNSVSIHMKQHVQHGYRHYDQSYLYFSSLVEGSSLSEDYLTRILKEMKWQSDDVFQVSIIQFRNPEFQYYPLFLHSLLEKTFPFCYILGKEGRIYLFQDLSRSESVPNEEYFSRLFPSGMICVGQSSTQTNAAHIPILINQAERALFTARETGAMFVSFIEISMQAILKMFHSDRNLQALVHPAIILLKELDDNYKTGFGYLNTLEVYLMSGANISAASRKLKIHRNTLINRIERIKELTGLTLSDSKELEELLLSIIVFDK